MTAAVAHTPAWHGPDHEYVFPGRQVVAVADRVWPYPPEECPMGDADTEWVNNGTALICRGCGLDST